MSIEDINNTAKRLFFQTIAAGHTTSSEYHPGMDSEGVQVSDQYQENWKSALSRAISDAQQLVSLLTAARGQQLQSTTIKLIDDCDRFIEKIRVNIQIAKDTQ